MNRRAAAFQLVPLVVLLGFVAACGGDNASISPTVRIVYEAELSQTPDVDPDTALKTAADVIERRVDGYGAKANVHREDGTGLTVELADIGAEEAQKLTGQTGLLEFREAKVDDNGDFLLCQGGTVTYNPPACDGGQEVPTPPDSLSRQSYESVIWVPAMANGSDGQEVALTSRFLKPNTFASTNTIGLPIVNFEMTAEGAPLLEQVTFRLIGLPLAFFLDGEPIQGDDGYILAPTVRAVISDKGIINGFSAQEARMLSIQLNSGVLPVPLKVIKVEDLAE